MGTASYPTQADTGSLPIVFKEPGDQRFHRRFELAVECDLFQLWGAKRLVWHASGTTVDWSRNSILLRCGPNLETGSSTRLVVHWTAGVQLIVVGRVIRSDERGMVLKILRRRFHGRPALIVSLDILNLTFALGPD